MILFRPSFAFYSFKIRLFVLLKSHNMDQTESFMHESTEFFVNENLERYIRGENLLNHVDKSAGY